MKKILLVTAISFLAVGCGAKQASVSNPTQNTTVKSYSMTEVSAAKSAEKCWVAISGKVYDLTNWVGMHPGGPENILAICGTDATQAFDNQHAGQRRPADELVNFEIGVLK